MDNYKICVRIPGLIWKLEYYVEAVLTPEQAEELGKLYSMHVHPIQSVYNPC